MNHATDAATADEPGGADRAGLRRAPSPEGPPSQGGLADVLTSYRADVIRISVWLRLGFLVVLALASGVEHRGSGPLPLPEAAVLSGYGFLALGAAAARRRLPAPGPRPRFAETMLWGDVVVVIVLALVSDGAPALALALFLVPMFAGFQLPVRRTAALAGVCLVAYLLLLAGDARLRERTVDENALAVLAFLVLTCLSCLVVARQIQERTERIHQLTCERAQLLAEVMCVEERERAVLAELLHDGPLQSVLAVRLELGTAQRLAGPDGVATARVRLLDISRQLRDLTTELHPVMLEAKGIGHVLSLLANTTAERSGLRGDCEVTVRHDAEQPDPREGLVFTAARELLNNVVLHAQATRFGISLTDEAGTWRLEVRDDGRGIAPDEPRSKLLGGHIGLASLRIRIEAVRGTMEITSGPDGTTVAITLPSSAPPVPGFRQGRRDGRAEGRP
ncbi:sensor histidine kinase [Streptomyces sp. NPDC086023]|uniref:sensor histidine kinase n=1 Tax=Streptomyces sp. NPDC086023 TaxID=3365746 RepID=UPI0037D61AF2